MHSIPVLSLLLFHRYMSIRAWVFESYLRLLQYLGRAPKDLEKITSTLKTLQDLDAMDGNQYLTAKREQRKKEERRTLKKLFYGLLPEVATDAK